jgi:hypothetical protein
MPIQKHNGSWGFWSISYFKTGESFPIKNANGMWTLNNQLFTFNSLHVFLKYDNETGKYSNKTAEYVSKFSSVFDSHYNLISEISSGINIFTTMVSEAAKNNPEKFIRGIRNVANKVNSFVGVATNTYDARKAYKKGHKAETWYQVTQIGLYLAGTAMLFIPGIQVAGGYIIMGNSIIDFGEYFYVNWQI